jgi:methionyl-tRNA formyltransferase
VARLRIGYLCMESVFSVRPLEALLRAGHDVRFVLRPIGPLETRTDPTFKRHRGFDVAMRRALGFGAEVEKTNPLALAADRDIPAYLVGNASTPAVQKLVKKEQVDLLVIAFFNQLIKPAVFTLARLGAINFHPSLLPQYRGPAPLFWTFRDGVEEAGLTVHQIAAGEDNGAVLRQIPISLPTGTAGEDFVDVLADVAAEAVNGVVDDVAGGARGVAQDDRLATRAPRPTEHDLGIDASWSARRAYHFARGCGRWNPLWCAALGEAWRVVDADSYDDSRALPGEHALMGDLLHLGCTDGVVRLRVRKF